MNVSLTPELEKLVQEKVATGLYQTASEVIREGLRLLKEQDEQRARKLDALRRDIAVGIAEADAGKTKPFDAQDLKKKLAKRLAARKRA